VPFLVLFATLLFASRDWVDRLIKRGDGEQQISLLGRIWGFLFQLFIATYGGYFGAGIGILMLESFSVMGMSDIHKMNGLKTIIATLINVIAFIYFAIRGLVDWPIAVVMGIGTVAGGFGGARLARRIDQRLLRIFIILVGFGVSAWFYFNNKHDVTLKEHTISLVALRGIARAKDGCARDSVESNENKAMVRGNQLFSGRLGHEHHYRIGQWMSNAFIHTVSSRGIG
jgi:hypothetical protein